MTLAGSAVFATTSYVCIGSNVTGREHLRASRIISGTQFTITGTSNGIRGDTLFYTCL